MIKQVPVYIVFMYTHNSVCTYTLLELMSDIGIPKHETGP